MTAKAVAIATAMLLCLSACAATPIQTDTAGDGPVATDFSWRLDFDGADLWNNQGVGTVSSASLEGGNYQVVASWDGSKALQFPRFGSGAGFVLLVGDKEHGLPSPEGGDIEYGADARIDAPGVSADDDGDNVLQRGLGSDDSQLKLQIDAGYPSCVVKGALGTLVAKSKKLLSSRVWYRLRCERHSDRVTLTVKDLQAGEEERSDARGATGPVVFLPPTPFSIGRKVTAAGVPVVSNSDQFNGMLDNLWVKY